jgi:SAM-dependent methyltransferase
MDWKLETVRTYDRSAQALADYFQGIGPRVEDIERGLVLAGNPEAPRVVEIGCGDGRDAAEIIPRAAWYEGFDPSEGLLTIARQRLPKANFKMADALSYDYTPRLDVVFAFASLLHVNQPEMTQVLGRVATALRVGGIFYILLKERAGYSEEIRRDKYGERMFYYYNEALITHSMSSDYQKVYGDRQRHGGTDWFTLALKKV